MGIMKSPKTADTAHAAFLKRNSEMVAAILEAAFPQPPGERLPLLDELTLLIALNQVSALLDSRARHGWQRLFNDNPPAARATWAVGDWTQKLRHRRGVEAEAPLQLYLLYHELARRSDFPTLHRSLRWGQPRWRLLLRRIGCSPDLAGTVTSLILDRTELPSGPLTSHLYTRLGFISRREGRPQTVDVMPKYIDSLKWRFQQLAAERCTPVIRPGSKACIDCPVRSFCRAYRNARPQKPRSNVAFVDLFAGPGGLSLGFRRAGLQLLMAVDKERHAADTLYLNHPEAREDVVHCRDVRSLLRNRALLTKLKGVPVVTGGPPCQAFSMARRHSSADRRDPRRRSVFDFVRAARELNPLIVVMENVPGIQNARDGEAFSSILRAFGRAGFVVEYRSLNAAAYGVPQNRSRVFFVGVNRRRVAAAGRVLQTILAGMERAVARSPPLTVRQALNGLPRIRPGDGALVTRTHAPGRSTDYAEKMSNGSAFIFNHQARPHNKRDLAIFRDLSWGETARDFDARNPGRIPYNLDSFGDKYRRLHPGKPSPTIPSHLKRDANSFVHPFVPRGITPREAARLQSFPDSYVFLGGFGPSFVQIGNAVPPLLAEVLGREVAKAVS